MAEKPIKNSFYGIGWNFPPTFDKREGTTDMVTSEMDIAQSLEILLTTQLGERIMQPEYGTELSAFVFQIGQASIGKLIARMLESKIVIYEPRVKVDDIDIDTSRFLEGVLSVTLEYTIRQTNNRRNIVYPFFLGEGTFVPPHLTGTK